MISENVTMKDSTFYLDGDENYKIENKQTFSFIKLKDNNKVIVRAYSPINNSESEYYLNPFEQYFLVEVKDNKAIARNYWSSFPASALKEDVAFDVENNLFKTYYENLRMGLYDVYKIDEYHHGLKSENRVYFRYSYQEELEMEDEVGGEREYFDKFTKTEFIPLTYDNIYKCMY